MNSKKPGFFLNEFGTPTKIVFCKHNMCKDEPTCLEYQMFVCREQERTEFEESFPELSGEFEEYF